MPYSKERTTRPAGNLTGINYFNGELAAKRLGLLHDLVPKTVRVAVLLNPAGGNAEIILWDVQEAARVIGLQIRILSASMINEIDAAFTTLARKRPDALFVGNSTFFSNQRVQFATLAARHRIPTAYPNRRFVDAGGLMSYGTSRPSSRAIDQVRVF